jgi:hypothetical protein
MKVRYEAKEGQALVLMSVSRPSRIHSETVSVTHIHWYLGGESVWWGRYED